MYTLLKICIVICDTFLKYELIIICKFYMVKTTI